MTQNIQQVFDESIGQTPDHMSIRNPDENARVASLGTVADRVLDAPDLFEHVGQWEPESILNFSGSELEFLSFRQKESVGSDNEGWTRARVANDVIELAKVLRIFQFDANLLEGFPLCGATGRSIDRLRSASRKRHVSRPRIPLSNGPLDQEYFNRSRALPKHDRDGSVRLIRQIGLLRHVRAQSFSNKVDLHAHELSERGPSARASRDHSG